ncbi:TonB-dependent receptor [soil metagenome]
MDMKFRNFEADHKYGLVDHTSENTQVWSKIKIHREFSGENENVQKVCQKSKIYENRIDGTLPVSTKPWTGKRINLRQEQTQENSENEFSIKLHRYAISVDKFKSIIKKAFLCIAILFIFSNAFAQQKYSISGYLKDSESGEDLIGASIYISQLNNGTTTNVYGFYSLSLPAGTYHITYSYMGYLSQTQEVELNSNKTLNINLAGERISLQEVIVSAEKMDKNVEDIQMSTNKVNIVDIRKMPQLLGEVDIIRSIQLLPGVSTVGEGASGFNVRGGAADQNLILLDEAPVYNSSHLMGFFSIFNADAIKDLKLYKGGIPSNYGGRLSSVLDVRQREGNMKNFTGNGGIGIISSRLNLEGPLKKDKSSFMVAGRRSYADLFLKLSGDEDLSDNALYFYDLNAKVNYILNSKNRIYLSGYFGKDVASFGDNFSLKWGNTTGTFRWNHLFNDRLFANFTAVYSDYNYSLGIPEGTQAFEWDSNILSQNLKADFQYFLNPRNTIDFGVDGIFYTFQPGKAKPLNEGSIFNNFELEHRYGLESAVYISNEQKIDNRLTLQYGLRYSQFMNMGSGSVYTYAPGEPRSTKNIIDTTFYKGGEVIKHFHGPEPRFSAKYSLTHQSSVKASYNRMRQYIHLVSNTSAATPLDVWAPSGPHVNPSKVDQVTLGYFRNLNDNAIELSAEVYYKKYYDLLDYVDGAELLLNKTIETEFINGQGRAYGIELLARKEKGRMTGWVGYTLSRTERQVPGLNESKYFPANYDKTHDLTIVVNYELSKSWNISANFAYMTGRPITYPDGRYEWEGHAIPNYSNRNGARVPDYHRLDFSANYERPGREHKKWQSSWSFGLYNVYARRNPYSVFFRQNENNPAVTEAVRFAVFGSVIPSVTYNFKF